MSTNLKISDEQIHDFRSSGWMVVKGFYDVEREISPILKGIWEISHAIAKRHSLKIDRRPFSIETFDQPYYEIKAHSRAFAAEVYDLIKLIPAFIRLIGSEKNEALFRALRPEALVGVGRGSFGIRIDNPGEEKYATLWHQDYLSHFGSVDGLVLWAPLVPVSEEMGPVKLLRGSHIGGIRPMSIRDHSISSQSRDFQVYANNFAISNENNLSNEFEVEAPTSDLGDLVAIEYLTIHKSGVNHGKRARWTMQHRLFNFLDSTGMKIGWHGGFAVGTNPAKIYPEYFGDQHVGD